MSIFKNKKLLITGGTGSFGHAVCKRFIDSEISEIRIFSRDEKKQDDMRINFSNEKLKFYIGDVRDRESLDDALKGVDYVFHAAALKQVPSCEFYPMEAVKTNIIGTHNLIQASISNSVEKVVCLSTDKAAYPINAMGISKAMMEKVFVAASRNCIGTSTIICGTRYGNVMSSRGSVIPLFLKQIKMNEPITITDKNMTRFMMTLDDAVDLVIYAFENGENGDLFVQKAPAATIEVLSNAITKLLGKNNHPIKTIGSRHGEKLFETLLTKEELNNSVEYDNYYKVVSDNRNLNYGKYFTVGDEKKELIEDYHSHNTYRLDVEEMTELLMKLKEIRDEVK